MMLRLVHTILKTALINAKIDWAVLSHDPGQYSNNTLLTGCVWSIQFICGRAQLVTQTGNQCEEYGWLSQTDG